jgi:hypothetical protein
VKTLFVSYRVTDLDRSLGFYTALGYAELGRVEAGDGTRLVILKKPAWSRSPSSIRAALTARRRRGSRTRTATGSSWWNGRPDIPTASPQQTSPETVTEMDPQVLTITLYILPSRQTDSARGVRGGRVRLDVLPRGAENEARDG